MTAEFFRGAKQADFSRVKAIIICAYAHSNANSGTFISACRMCLLALPQYPTLHSISNVSKASKPALGATAAKVRFVRTADLEALNDAAGATKVRYGEAALRRCPRWRTAAQGRQIPIRACAVAVLCSCEANSVVGAVRSIVLNEIGCP